VRGGVGEQEDIGAIRAGLVAQEGVAHPMDIGGATIAARHAGDAGKLIGLDRHGAAGGHREGGQDRDREGEAMPTAEAHFLDVFFFVERAALMRALARSR